ncbi:MAG TPA: UvrD-helicase domain-containing protein [Gemmatimonadaceae bacterium]|nr:UvrD-helicase domain-containing protein [Gemmatimonadaceae bacterium]
MSGVRTDAVAIVPSPSQRRAIEAAPGPLLVLAGPGAGKTFCLIERIGWLVEHEGVAPARICAFTFTNKAADEIAARLESRLGSRAGMIRRGTIHAFCAELLREFGAEVGLDPGFGIADDEYQQGVLRRIEGPRRWHGQVLKRFSALRFRGEELFRNDRALFEEYEKFLATRGLLDFDMLVLKAAELMERPGPAATIRARWDAVLVDEFQDLNPVQYAVIRALALEHRHVFAVGDDEQSIYSWAGADPQVFRLFVNDFGIAGRTVSLEENRRCPRHVFALARRLLLANTPIFDDRRAPNADRETAYPVRALSFTNDDDEAAWLVDDLRADHAAGGHRWGDVAILYRTHEIGYRLETALLAEGIPCRLARGHALADDPVAGYVLAALKVIAHPDDDLFRNDVLKVVLPRALYDEALTQADQAHVELRRHLGRMAARLPRGDERARQVRRALADLRNLEAIRRQHDALAPLVHDLLSRRVGRVSSVLNDHHDELSDPMDSAAVRALAERLRTARSDGAFVHLPPMGGAEIGIQGMLVELGLKAVRGADPPPGAVGIGADATPEVGLALGVFKAAQLLEMEPSATAFDDFTAIDTETTGTDPRTAEVLEVAAVRVRDGRIVDTWVSLVKPRGAVPAAARAVHGITDEELATARPFADVWPEFRAFCGDDIAVAHNGYAFDFPLLHRLATDAGHAWDLVTYDSLPLARDLFPTSRKLKDLARHFGVDLEHAHRALDDTKALAQVMLALGRVRQQRARKTALAELLGHLGVALALCDEATLPAEARLLRDRTNVYALGRYGGALEWFEAERTANDPTRETLITRLGGERLMAKVRATRTADERYPVAMMRLRRLMAGIRGPTLDAELATVLERAALSQQDGREPEPDRVNLLTLHSTKGLEFSRVYVVGVEDARLPGGSPTKGPTKHEVEEARRLLYVGMTRTIDRLVLTRVATRNGAGTGGHQFLDEMGVVPEVSG